MPPQAPKSHSSGSGGDAWLWVIIALIIIGMSFGLTKPFTPVYLNLGYFFAKILPFWLWISSAHTWFVLGIISVALSIFFIGIIIFSLVRMREIQLHERAEIDHEIHEALARDAENERNENPRWRYIQTLLESPNESDWRVAIIEADTMLDELLSERGYSGETLADKLKVVDAGAFTSLQNAWDAHGVRNEIAHSGSEFPLSQVEARRTIKMFQTVFEELRAI